MVKSVEALNPHVGAVWGFGERSSNFGAMVQNYFTNNPSVNCRQRKSLHYKGDSLETQRNVDDRAKLASFLATTLATWRLMERDAKVDMLYRHLNVPPEGGGSFSFECFKRIVSHSLEVEMVTSYTSNYIRSTGSQVEKAVIRFLTSIGCRRDVK
ncbi:hypothetical protein TNCV_1367091 [Trichonephila clavipes]|nr:hypothetical protein TNCV_1367091 [Trichonephila clavipes]